MNSIPDQIRIAIHIAEQEKTNLKGKSLITFAARKIARDNFGYLKDQSKDHIFDLCVQLLNTNHWEERTIAFEWAFRIRKHYESRDFSRFESWLEKYVHDWSSCDDFCTHAFGHLIYAFPNHISALKTWTHSEDRWFRRGAAVVMIYGIRRKHGFKPAFEIADLLLMDDDDLVQKGYGWMLKEISKLDPHPVFEFVMDRKDRMPRTALRYAIEKLDPDLREQAMMR